MIRDFRTGELVENWNVLRRLLERSGMKKSVFHRRLQDEFSVIYETPSQISEYMNPKSSRQIPSWRLLYFMTCLIKSTKERDYYVAEFIKERLPLNLHEYVSGEKKVVTLQANKARIRDLEVKIAQLEYQNVQNQNLNEAQWKISDTLSSICDRDYLLIKDEFSGVPGFQDFIETRKELAVQEIEPLTEALNDLRGGRSSISWQREFEPFAMEELYTSMAGELEAVYQDPEMLTLFKMFFIDGEHFIFLIEDWVDSYEITAMAGSRDIRDITKAYMQQPFCVVAAFFESENSLWRASKLEKVLTKFTNQYPKLFEFFCPFGGLDLRRVIRNALRELIARSKAYKSDAHLSVFTPYSEFIKAVYPEPPNGIFDKVIITHMVHTRTKNVTQRKVVGLGHPVKAALIEEHGMMSLADLYKSREHDLKCASAAEHVAELSPNEFDYICVGGLIEEAFDYLGPLPFSASYIDLNNSALTEYTKNPSMLDNSWLGIISKELE